MMYKATDGVVVDKVTDADREIMRKLGRALLVLETQDWQSMSPEARRSHWVESKSEFVQRARKLRRHLELVGLDVKAIG